MNFILGCNYWASNAGTEMWNNWNENSVENDLRNLAQYGIEYLRVFPNWRDFQPVYSCYGPGNAFKEFRNASDNLFDNEYYLDMNMMKRFEKFCEISNKYNLKLIVGLITGWMSGRMFIPPALFNTNIHTDALPLMLQQKFVKGFVSYFKNNNAIYAWDLGNECNCLGTKTNYLEATVWTETIANAIRSNDNTRPIISGMHGLGINTAWTIKQQAEANDILTTHPYPHFVPHCFKDDMISYRTLLHATCESVYYSTVGNKPCLVEEIGQLGPCTCDDDVVSAFLRTNLYSNWANGMMGLMWWCAHEQVELTTAPYSWIMMERELGLLDKEMKPKKILYEMKKFADFLKTFNADLPALKYDGVCVLTEGQDHWAVTYMSYMLGKQAGVNIAFASQRDTLPDSEVYLLPSIAGDAVMRKELFDEIVEKVKAGATLYISNNNGCIAQFEEITGVHIRNSKIENTESTMEFKGSALEFSRGKRYNIESKFGIATEADGDVVFTKYSYGKGTVYYLNFPLETMLIQRSYFDKSDYYKIYEEIFNKQLEDHIASKTNKYIGLTLHEDGDKCYAVLINYSDKPQETGFSTSGTYEIDKVIKGDPYTIAANDVAVVLISKQH